MTGLAPVVHLSRTSKDFYNATRAIIELAELSVDAGEQISETEQSQLINAYHFVFSERFPNLFDRCHSVLWKSFSDNDDKSNLLTLFRHRSLFWRLRGNEASEKKYLQEMRIKIGESTDKKSANLSREAAYYYSRISNLLPPQISKTS